MEKLELLRALAEGKRIAANWINVDSYYYLNRACQLRIKVGGLDKHINALMNLVDLLKSHKDCSLFHTQKPRPKQYKAGDFIQIADYDTLIARGFTAPMHGLMWLVPGPKTHTHSSAITHDMVGKEVKIIEVSKMSCFPGQQILKLEASEIWWVNAKHVEA